MNKIVSLCAVLALLIASIPLTVFAQADEGATEGGSRTIYLPIIAQNSQAEEVTDAATQGDLYTVPNVGSNSDNAHHPLGDRQSARKLKALPARLNGKVKGKTHQVARGQYVELARQGQELIWTVLGEFGAQINPTYGGAVGPLHNQIAQPDRSTDNVTIWQPDFNRTYYETILFNATPGAISLRNYYLEQSANRYTVSGDVTDWVQVPYNEANYGSNYCGYFFCARTWLFVRDSVEAWYNTQLAAGKSSAEINAYLSKFDVWDRYDYDGDGNFNEPDGYIDHFQSIHAGEGEEFDGVVQGSDAIWSHRWYAFYNLIGVTGPSFNKQGGVRVGNSDYWVGDYTIEPENGGVGIFAHEFGHDLGLPDLYDISMNTGVADNSVGYWSLYDLGNYGSGDGADNFPGTKPISMSAYEKIFLGWSNYQVVRYGQSAAVKLERQYKAGATTDRLAARQAG